MRARSAILMLVILGLLTACDTTQSLRELRSAAPASDPYQQALAEGYRGFAEAKESNYDWWTSKYFADKGLMAAYGRDTQPEDVANWNIPATLAPQFTDARTKLIAAVLANRATRPALAAGAVVTYDRWVEAQHNRWDVARIEETRDAFFDALTQLSEAHTAEVSGEGETSPPTPVESTSTIIYFPMNSDTLGASAQAAVAELVRYVQSAGEVTISINGHADRVGSATYNMNLSERRARFVMKALAVAGIPSQFMKYFAFGETDPAVATRDGVAEPKNRRVEIFIE